MQKAGIILIGAIVVAFLGMGIFIKSMDPPPEKTKSQGTDAAPKAPPVLSKRYTKAADYAKANPYEYENIINRFQHIAREAKRGTDESRLAKEKLKAAQKELHHLQYTIMPPLLQKTNALAIQGKHEEAIKLLEEFEGEYKDHTEKLRKQKIMEYKTQQRQKIEMEKRNGSGPPDESNPGGGSPPPASRDRKTEELKKE